MELQMPRLSLLPSRKPVDAAMAASPTFSGGLVLSGRDRLDITFGRLPRFSGAQKYTYRPLVKSPRVDVAQLRNAFEIWAGRKPAALTFGPNRVNLIGEHTDYNDGFVLPIAMELGTYAAVAPRNDRTLRIRTVNPQDDQPQELIINLDEPGPLEKGSWGNYAKGTIQMVEEFFNIKVPGMDILVQSDGPSGSGLSSSAAFETAIGMAALTMAGKARITDKDRMRLARAGQKAEHNYANVKCGIMDQAASGLCKPGHALKLDCRLTPSGAYKAEHVPVNFPDAVFVVMDSRLARKLEKSAYNERRDQCENAVGEIGRQSGSSITALRDVSVKKFKAFQDTLPELTRRRARHVVTENDRVLKAVKALKAGDAKAFGALMNASHDSLRDDYEVSSEHLDTLVSAARRVPGTYGARLTGAGFGGCAVALVRKDAVEAFQKQVSQAYQEAFGEEPAFYVTAASGGARVIED